MTGYIAKINVCIPLLTQVILNDEEEVIVRTLYKELLNRQAFDGERFYFTPPRQSELWWSWAHNVVTIVC